MIVVGLSAYAHDAAAAVLVDGRLAAMAEEERFNREKHSGAFPHGALAACLADVGARPADVARIGFFLDPARVAERIRGLGRDDWPFGALEWARNSRAAAAVPRRLRADLAQAGLRAPCTPVEHHRAHAVAAFAHSGFERAAICVADGKGEHASTTLARGVGRTVTLHADVRYPHSLGYFYSVLTRFLGFRPWGGEGKVMGLAPYGAPRFAAELRTLCPANPDGSFHLDLRYFRHHRGLPWIGPRLVALLGPPRAPEAELTDRHRDLAASLQLVLEERLLAIAQHLRAVSGETRLACAGGVFLNASANWRLRTAGAFAEVFVDPISHDAGTAVGAALDVAAAAGEPPPGPLRELFLGPPLDPAEVDAACRAAGDLVVERVADPADTAARLLAEGHVVGFVQGRMEVGPRALGARSILADPRSAGMKDVVNARVKRREGFRPFAPAVLAERAAEWFVDAGPFRHMIVVVPVRPERRAAIPAVVHADGTGRVQTVHADTNPVFHRLVWKFAERTGVPVVLNTSFNLRGEAMVRTAADAIDCMRRTDLDHCVVGDAWVRKR